MGLSAGSVTIGLGADYGNLTRDLYKANATLGKFAAGIPRLLANPLVAGGAMITGALAGMQSEITKAMQSQVFADSIGTSSGNITALQNAAKKAGIDLEKMNAAMSKVSVTVSQAAMGVGEGGEALKKLGLDASTLSRLGVDEQIRQIGRALDGLPDRGERAAITMKLFGESGVKMSSSIIDAANSMSRMNDALTYSNKELAKLGSYLTPISTKTTELAASFALLANTWIELGTGKDVGLFNMLSGQAAMVEKTNAEVAGTVRAAAENMKAIRDQALADQARALKYEEALRAEGLAAQKRDNSLTERTARKAQEFNERYMTAQENLQRDITQANWVGASDETINRMKAALDAMKATGKAGDIGANAASMLPAGSAGAAVINRSLIDVNAVSQNASLAIQAINEQKMTNAILGRIDSKMNGTATIGGSY